MSLVRALALQLPLLVLWAHGQDIYLMNDSSLSTAAPLTLWVNCDLSYNTTSPCSALEPCATLGLAFQRHSPGATMTIFVAPSRCPCNDTNLSYEDSRIT